MTWIAVAGELQRDWARETTASLYGAEILGPHAGSTGTGLAWELQLMNGASAAPAGATV